MQQHNNTRNKTTTHYYTYTHNNITTISLLTLKPEVMEPKIVDNEEWTKARIELLEEEKALSRATAELAAKRRRLPWCEIKEDYVLTDSNGVAIKISELIEEDDSDLIVYHL